MTAPKEAVAASQLPAGFIDLGAIPVETEIPCRPESNAAFIGPKGVFTNVAISTRRTSTQFFGSLLIVTFDLTLNLFDLIKPEAKNPTCNSADGVTFVATASKNVFGVNQVVRY